MIKKIDKNSIRVRKHHRVRKKISGTSLRPRLCVFRSNKNIFCQVIDDSKGITLCEASSVNFKLSNGGNKEGASLVGEEIAKKCLEKNINEVVFDRAGYLYHGRVKALAEAARSKGLKF